MQLLSRCCCCYDGYNLLLVSSSNDVFLLWMISLFSACFDVYNSREDELKGFSGAQGCMFRVLSLTCLYLCIPCGGYIVPRTCCLFSRFSVFMTDIMMASLVQLLPSSPYNGLGLVRDAFYGAYVEIEQTCYVLYFRFAYHSSDRLFFSHNVSDENLCKWFRFWNNLCH